MINIAVGSPAQPRAYVRVDEITAPSYGEISANFRTINAIKATRKFALMWPLSSGMQSLCGLKEAKDFVESFITNLANAANAGKPMVLTSGTMSQENLEMLVAVIMLHSNCRYCIHIKP